MQSYSDLIARLGGPAGVAPIIGAKVETVRKMADRESIPSQYWAALITAARTKRVSGVTFASLAGMKKPRKAHSPAKPRDKLSGRNGKRVADGGSVRGRTAGTVESASRPG